VWAQTKISEILKFPEIIISEISETTQAATENSKDLSRKTSRKGRASLHSQISSQTKTTMYRENMENGYNHKHQKRNPETIHDGEKSRHLKTRRRQERNTT
jgi:flagellar basal body L-ring protein FlgH